MSDPLGAFRLLRPSRPGSEPRAARAPAAAFTRGTVVADRYQLVGFLGQGGTADVYLAADFGLERHVALKVLREPTPQRQQRFEREAQIAASIKHPNVVSVFGAGVHAGHAYVAYELIEGAQPLDEAAQGLDLDGRLLLFEQLLAGVAAAHALGVTHRDLKPDNVLVQPPGRLFVADFGLAHVPESSLTATGQFMGTPSYMAPEQVVGGGTSPATDVWALGLMLYELVYQRSWYDPGTPLQTLLAQIVQGRLERPPGAPPELERLIFKEVLLKEPSQRLPNAEAFLNRLRQLRHPAPEAPATGLRTAALLLVGALLGAAPVALLSARESLGPAPADSAPPASQVEPSRPTSPGPSPARAASSPSPAAARQGEPYGTQAYFARRRELLQAETSLVLSAAEKGDLAALRLGGVRLAFGWRTKQDLEGGIEMLKRASQLGCPDSPGDLARIFSRRDPERSKRWEDLARERGSVWAQMVRVHEDLSLPPPVGALRPKIEAGDDEAARHLALYFALSGRAEEAENWASVAIAMGSSAARGLRGMLALHSRPKSMEGVVADLQAAAQVGDTIAIFELIRCYLQGKGVDKDLREAKRLFQTYRRAGGPDSSRALLLIYRDFTEANASGRHYRLKTAAVQLIKEEANPYVRGEAALFLLDLSRAMNPSDREEVLAEARTLFRTSHRSLNPQVHVRYGLSLSQKVIPSPRAKQEAFAAFERAHRLGSPAGTSNMGACLLDGTGVEPDPQRALELLKHAAEGGFPRAWLNLGRAHSMPQLFPDLVSYPKALAAYARAGELGLARAYYERGKLLAKRGLEIHDPELAKRDFMRAADRRTDTYAEAAYILEKNGALAQARELYELSLKAGDDRGIADLARILLEGLGGEPEPERAVQILLAAEPTKATCNLLADCYAKGRGVAVDLARAKEWRQRASRLDK